MHDDHEPPRNDAHRFPRRQFLRDAALLSGGAAALAAAPATSLAAPGQPLHLSSALMQATPAATAASGSYTPVALTTDELATLKAILARLIPADELGPGAVEANVHVYIDQSLIGAYKDDLPLYHQNLAAINKAATSQGAASFAALSADQQDALLKKLESLTANQNAVQGGSQGGGLTGASAGFFPLLLEHTREGMFGDPMYGGNKDFAGWNLIGFSGIRLVWSAEQQALGSVVPPAHVSDSKFGGEPFS